MVPRTKSPSQSSGWKSWDGETGQNPRLLRPESSSRLLPLPLPLPLLLLAGTGRNLLGLDMKRRLGLFLLVCLGTLHTGERTRTL